MVSRVHLATDGTENWPKPLAACSDKPFTVPLFEHTAYELCEGCKLVGRMHKRGNDMNVDYEGRAWRWLLSLERLPFDPAHPRAQDRQVIIRACPGNHDGTMPMPGVLVSIAHPDLAERLHASGNSLSAAVAILQGDLWRKGIHMPYHIIASEPLKFVGVRAESGA
jgi:hypothetical protein